MLTARDLSQLGINPAQTKFRVLLDDLQGNILKPHGRDHVILIFFTIERGKARVARAWIRALAAEHVTSAHRQLCEADDYREKKAAHKRRAPGKPFCTFLLSAAGYLALGRDLRPPSDSKFRAGMKRSRARLRDPAPSVWQEHYRGEIHGWSSSLMRTELPLSGSPRAYVGSSGRSRRRCGSSGGISFAVPVRPSSTLATPTASASPYSSRGT
jgi:hypothetical protein